jgi:heme oxygenase (biliverdin-IX-beta and delta-forming)
MIGADGAADRGAAARRLIRSRDHAALATSFEGGPYVSLVATACDLDASPLLLLSDLAQHTGNLRADPHVSLLFDESDGHPDPLAAPRLTLLGRAERVNDPNLNPRTFARFAARHPASVAYAGFADFHLYRITIERGHLVAGFGRIAWIEAAHLRFAADASALANAEAEIVAHMNADHGEAIALYAERLLGLTGEGWRMTGIDPEGLDLRRPMEAGGETARLDFASCCQGPVLTPEAARGALVALADQARSTAPGE